MQIRGRNIGVCSWSLQPRDCQDLVAKVRSLGLEHVQLGLNHWMIDPEKPFDQDVQPLRDSGLQLTSTTISFPGEDYSTIAALARSAGFVPDEPWPFRREMAIRAGDLTAQLGLSSLEFHVGFIPFSSDPTYRVLVDRVREVATEIGKQNVNLLVETGQATGSEFLQFLNDTNCRNVGVNFDPANMLIYGSGDPIDAISILNRHIKHVHLKDALISPQPRVQWGTEVRLGTGKVNFAELFDALDEIDFEGPMCIERESGIDRLGDIRLAIDLLRQLESAEDDEVEPAGAV